MRKKGTQIPATSPPFASSKNFKAKANAHPLPFSSPHFTNHFLTKITANQTQKAFAFPNAPLPFLSLLATPSMHSHKMPKNTSKFPNTNLQQTDSFPWQNVHSLT